MCDSFSRFFLLQFFIIFPVLKTGASGLIAYRLLVKETNKWQWLQSSARLVYKNSKPDFILCSHRPLMEEEGRDLLGKRTMDFKVTYLDGGLGAMTERSSSSASLMSDSEFVMRCQRNRRYKGSKEGSAGGGSASASPGSTCSNSHKGSQHMADVTMLNGSNVNNNNNSNSANSNGALVNNNNNNNNTNNNNSNSLVNNQLTTLKGNKRKASSSVDNLHHQHPPLGTSMSSGGGSGCADPYALTGLTAEVAAAAAAAASINFGHHHSTHHQLHHHTHHTQYPGHHALNPTLTSHHGAAHHAALSNSMYHTLSHSSSPGAVTSPASGHTHNSINGSTGSSSAPGVPMVIGSSSTGTNSDQLSPSGGSGSGGTSVLSAPSPPPPSMAALNAAYATAAAAAIPPNFLTAMDYHNHAAARSFLAPDSFLHYSRHALGSYYPDHPYHPHAHPTHQYTTNYY